MTRTWDPSRPPPVMLARLKGDDNGDGRIDEDESGWNPKTMGNHRGSVAGKPATATQSSGSSSFAKLHPRAPAGVGGGQFVPVGAARDSKAATAQKDKGAAQHYAEAMKAGDAKGYLKGMKSADLEKLTRYAYSSKTSEPHIVALRLRLAAEMGSRKLDVKKYGALGGGLAAKAVHKKAAAKKR